MILKWLPIILVILAICWGIYAITNLESINPWLFVIIPVILGQAFHSMWRKRRNNDNSQ